MSELGLDYVSTETKNKICNRKHNHKGKPERRILLKIQSITL